MVGTFQFISLKNAASGKYLGFQRELTATAASPKVGCVFILHQNASGQYAFQHKATKKWLAVDKEVTLDDKDTNAYYDLAWLVGLITLSRIAPDKKPRYLASKAGPMTPAMDAGPESQWELVPMMHPAVCWKAGEAFCGLDAKGAFVSTLDSQFYLTTLLMLPNGKGEVAFQTQNGKYVNVEASGEVNANAAAPSPSSSFVIEPWKKDPAATEWNISIRSVSLGKYLTRVGQGLKCNGETRDKFAFSLVDSDGIVKITDFKGKFVSVEGTNLMSGRNVTGNEDQFIFESYGPQLDQVAIRVSAKGTNYVSDKGGVLCIESAKVPGPNQLFSVTVGDAGKFAFKSASGKFITGKAIGGLSLTATEVSEATFFEYQFINRAALLPQDKDFMFIGTSEQSKGAAKIKPAIEILHTKWLGNGNYSITNSANQALSMSGKASWVDPSQGTPVHLEFFGNQIALKTSAGYITPDVPAGTYVVGATRYLYDF